MSCSRRITHFVFEVFLSVWVWLVVCILMMQTTHMLVGMLVGGLIGLFFVPELLPIIVFVGLVGGAVPDFDMYYGHRKTLHFPVYYFLVSVLSVFVTQILFGMGSSWWSGGVLFTVFITSAWMHCVMDVFGGGLELHPWRGESSRAVFSHYHDEWVAPKTGVGYDGSWRDMGLVSVLSAGILLMSSNSLVTYTVIVLFSISFVYTVLRRRLPTIALWIVSLLPERVREVLPNRYVKDDYK